MSKIIWKEIKGQFGYESTQGWVGKICLFIYHYGCLMKEDRDRPYILRLLIGKSEHSFRYANEEECKINAEKYLQFIKEQLK